MRKHGCYQLISHSNKITSVVKKKKKIYIYIYMYIYILSIKKTLQILQKFSNTDHVTTLTIY